nr:type II toxin-antitoxin system VapC family toxin [Sphingobium nicotianae]
MLYLDTSAIVPAFIREPATERVHALIAERGGEAMAISQWTLTEFSSALALKARMGAISEEILIAALAEWRLFTQALRSLPIEESIFREAASLCQRRDLGLRAGDALHLAVAMANGCALVTLDEQMAKAALALGVVVVEV